MNEIFPYASMIAAVLIFIVGFVFHWIGQLTSIINWEFATRLGLQEKGLPKEYKVYEHAIAVADVMIGWIYAVTAVGLLLQASWGFKLSLMTGIILIYHGFSYWFWTGNRRKDGNKLVSNTARISWSVANMITGFLAIALGWNAI